MHSREKIRRNTSLKQTRTGPRRSRQLQGALSLAAFAGVVAALPNSARAQELEITGFSTATWGNVTPSISQTARYLNYTDEYGNPRIDAGMEIGSPTSRSGNYIYWRFDNQTRYHGNLYEMNSAYFENIEANTPFVMSNLSYFNAEIWAPGSSIYELPVTTKINITNLVGVPAPTFNFAFRLNFTDNQGMSQGVPDTLQYINPSSPNTFTYGSKTYTMRLLGFSNNNGNTFTSTYQLPEYQTTTSQLFAQFEEVLGPRLYVDNQRQIFETRVGTSQMREVMVQNSGATGTTLTGYIGGLYTPSEFTSPTGDVFFALAAGQSTSRQVIYTPTARTAGQPDLETLIVATNVGSADVSLEAYALSPVYFSTPTPGSTINLGRVMNLGGASKPLPITNVTPDGEREELTYLTLNNLSFSGVNASEFSQTGIPNGQALGYNISRTANISVQTTGRGVKNSVFKVETDQNAALAGDGFDFQYNVTAVAVEKRRINATPINYGRVMRNVVQPTGETDISGDTTSDNFFTNPRVRAPGNSLGPIVVGADTADRIVNSNTGVVVSTRTVDATFDTVGFQEGIVPLFVTPEGLVGEGQYELGFPWSANPLDNRVIVGTPINYGRVMANTVAPHQQISTLTTTGDDAVFTRITLASGSFTNNDHTVINDNEVIFNAPDVSKEVVVRSTFTTLGPINSAIQLVAGNGVVGEGLLGEQVQPITIPIQANPVDNRVITATPVNFGKLFAGTPVNGSTTLSTTGIDAERTRVTVNLGDYGPPEVIATVPSSTLFNAPTVTAGATLASNFITPGDVSSSIQLDTANSGLTGEGLPGEQVVPVNINYQAEVYSRGLPSFVGDSQQTTRLIDFGTISTGAANQSFDIHNLLTSIKTAGLEFSAPSSVVGDTAMFSTNLSSFNLDGGLFNTFNANFSPIEPGTYTVTYTLPFHDQSDIQGAGDSDELTLTLTGTLAGAVGPTWSNIVFINPGFELVTPDASSSTNLGLSPGDYTQGFSTTVQVSGNELNQRFVPGWGSAYEFDSLSGVIRFDNPLPYASEEEYDGLNVAYLENDTFEQTVIGTFVADQTYEMTFLVGRETGESEFTAPIVELFLGNDPFTEISADTPTPAPGEFETWTYRYRITEDNPLFGLPITVRLTGSDDPINLDSFQMFIPGGSPGPFITEWAWPQGGFWSEIGKWSYGRPDWVGTEALFRGAINQPSLVYVDDDVTIGAMRFNHTTPYTIESLGNRSIHMQEEVSGGPATIEVQAGTHYLNANLIFESPGVITVASGSTLNLGSRIRTDSALEIKKNGTGQLNVSSKFEVAAGTKFITEGGSTLISANVGNHDDSLLELEVRGVSTVTNVAASQDLRALRVLTGARMNTTVDDLIIHTDSLSVTGQLNLRDTLMLVDYTGASPLASITAAIGSGYNGGLWNGQGIISENAASNPILAVGIIEASAKFGTSTFPVSYAGYSLDDTTILMELTVRGDVNLDHTVNFTDLLIVAQNYGQTGPWSWGDFNYDGNIGFGDLLTVAQAYGNSGWELSARDGFSQSFINDWQAALLQVPEPTTMSLLGGAALLTLRRRRR